MTVWFRAWGFRRREGYLGLWGTSSTGYLAQYLDYEGHTLSYIGNGDRGILTIRDQDQASAMLSALGFTHGDDRDAMVHVYQGGV